MEQTKKRKVIGFSSLLTLLVLVLFTVVSTTAAIVSAVINVNTTLTFEYTYDGHNFICYGIQDDDSSVAIALNENAESTTATSLSVPATATNAETGVTYDVIAIARGGFRYCNFTSYILPQSIAHINEEAFAYNQNLTTFDIPHLVDEIATGTFMDCIKLESIYYTNSNGSHTFGNDTITRIDDHAFDNCVALENFYCPKNVTYFGEACFQKCTQLVNFYFPSTIKVDDVIQNHIIVRPYAFAWCEGLRFVYFETNVQEIDDFAFVNCNADLNLKYNGTSIPTYTRTIDDTSVSQDHWRDTNISTNITTTWPIEIEHPTILVDDNYPCLRYTIENSVVYLDSANSRRPTVKVIDEAEISSEGSYAVIYKFDMPTEDVDGCYIVDDGALTIPNTLNGRTVKVIRESTFANNSEIKSVKFNEGLVQICNHAFFNCLNIETLDFSACDNLKEVSYYCFQDSSIQNKKLTSLILPNCLEYVGGYSFSNFVNCNSFSLPENIQCIADLAFYGLGKNLGTGTVDLILPKSLNDAAAAEANYFNFPSPRNFTHPYNNRKYAVGKYAFHDANALRTVTMEDDPDHVGDMSYTCSFYSNSFYGANRLFRFTTSTNLLYLGKDAFKNCTALREIFLTTAKSALSGSNYPWCIDEDNGNYGGTFFTGTSPELVIYVDGATAPGLLDSFTLTADNSKIAFGHKWNAETTSAYYNEIKDFEGSAGAAYLSRRCIPTYYGVDFKNDIYYWNPKTKAKTTAPVTLNDYNNGIVSFVKDTNDKYVVARYYYNDGKATDIIDLTSVPDISDGTTNLLYKIGDEAFAKNTKYEKNANTSRNRQPGLYFILPDTITEIADRAFYRRTGTDGAAENNGRYGVRVITYKKAADQYMDSDGTSTLTYSQLTAKFTAINGQSDADRRGYCVIPDGVTYLGKDACYNHIFSSVVLGANLTFIGNSAFYIHPVTGGSGTQYARDTLTSISIAANSLYEVSDNGLYYIGGGNAKKMLMYQASNISGPLSIAANTKAIGFEGCANTQYTSIALPSGLTTIYGGGFYMNTALTTVTGVADLRYIGTVKNANGQALTDWDDPTYTEVFDDSVEAHYSITDYRDYPYKPRHLIESLYGAFARCKNLTTVDFTQMSELRKLGRSAFDNCSALTYLSGTNTYTIKKYKASDGSFDPVETAINNKVLDLSNCTNLRSIGPYAFGNCDGIKYAIIPDNRGSASESTIYIGKDPELTHLESVTAQIFTENKSMSIFISETVYYAHQTYGSAKNAKTHYPANCFGKNNQLYYYIGGNADIPSSDHTALKYWTYDTNDDIIIFDSADDARVRFPAS